MLRIAIVEDDPMIGRLLKKAIQSDGMQVVVYRSGTEALDAINSDNIPEVVLMDINLPTISGIETTYILKNRYPGIEIIAQTIMEDADTILKAIKAGVSGYILKGASAEEIMESIKVVREGGSFLTGKVAKKMLMEFNKTLPEPQKKDLCDRFNLTRREEEILMELINGMYYKEIAAKLDISFHTVNTHIRRIYEKMQVGSKGEAVAKAMKII